MDPWTSTNKDLRKDLRKDRAQVLAQVLAGLREVLRKGPQRFAKFSQRSCKVSAEIAQVSAKIAGNAVSVPVVKLIAHRLVENILSKWDIGSI